MAKEDGMMVTIVVTVRASEHEPQFRMAEERLQEEAVSIVTEALRQETAVELQEVSLIDFEHCKWVFEDGMPLACGLSEPVRIYEDGSWSWPYSAKLHSDVQCVGSTFNDLVAFVRDHGGDTAAYNRVHGRR